MPNNNQTIFEQVYKANLDAMINGFKRHIEEERLKYSHTNYDEDNMRVKAFQSFRLKLATELTDNLKSSF
jgi:hypothetical protein